MRTEKKLRILFQKTNEYIAISEQGKSRTLKLPDGWEKKLREKPELWNAAEVSAAPLYDRRKWQILFSQIRYMDKRAWTADLVINICFAGILFGMEYLGAGAEDVVVYLMLAASLLGSVSILTLSHLFSGGLGELAGTCCFGVRQLAACQMLGLGSVNLLTLAFLICFSGMRWGAELLRMGIYAAVPFEITVSVCIGILRIEGFRGKAYPVAATGMISAAAFLALASVPRIYCASALVIWGGVMAVWAVVLALQIRQLFHAIEKGEILCTD